MKLKILIILGLLFASLDLAYSAYIPGPSVDSTTFTLGTTPEMPIGGVYMPNPQPVGISTPTAAVRITPYRSLMITPMDFAGVILGTSTTNPMKVDNSGVTQPISAIPSQVTATVTPGTGTWPVSGTFFQTLQPVSAIPSQVTATVTPGTGTWVTTGSALQNNATVTPGTGTWAVSGTFFQTLQPVSGIPSQVTATVTPGTGTWPVSGSFFQTTQPVSANPATITATVTPGTGTWTTTGSALQNNATVTPGTGTWSVTAIPSQVTATVTPGTGTWAVTGIPSQVTATVTPGTGTFAVSGTVTANQGTQAYMMISTTTLNVAGSFSATSTSNSTQTINTNNLPAAVTMIGGIGPTGAAQGFSVDASSYVNVHIQAGAGAGGTSSNFASTFPSAGTANGFINDNGTMQAARVDTSSAVYVTGSLTVSPSPISITDINGSTRTVGYQAGASSVPVSVQNTVTITGSISNTGFNVNNTPAVSAIPSQVTATVTPGTGTWTTTGSALQNNATVTPGTGTWAVTGIPSQVTATVTPGTGTFAVSGTVTANQGTQSYMITSTNTIPVSASITATLTNTTTGSFNGTFPGNGAAIGGVGPTGTFQAFAVSAASSVFVVGSSSDNVNQSTNNRLPVMGGIYQTDYGNGATNVQGRDSTADHGTDGLLWTAALPSFRPSSFIASTNTITSVANASDITGLCGNANKTVLVYGLRVSCTETTAGTVNLTVFKRSTRFAGVWSTMTAVAMDSTYGLVNSTAVWFTANPTLGTPVGHLDNYKLVCVGTASSSPNDIYVAPASWRMKPVVLRGANECVTVNLEGQTVTGGAFTAEWEWIETKTISP